MTSRGRTRRAAAEHGRQSGYRAHRRDPAGRPVREHCRPVGHRDPPARSRYRSRPLRAHRAWCDHRLSSPPCAQGPHRQPPSSPRPRPSGGSSAALLRLRSARSSGLGRSGASGLAAPRDVERQLALPHDRRRPFSTGDASHNLRQLAVISMGESWHNGHHAIPRSARHGLLRGQWDSSARLIRCFKQLGWATEVRWPSSDDIGRRADTTLATAHTAHQGESARGVVIGE